MKDSKACVGFQINIDKLFPPIRICQLLDVVRLKFTRSFNAFKYFHAKVNFKTVLEKIIILKYIYTNTSIKM